MFYKIEEVSTAPATGHAYVLVRFWQTRADFDAALPAALTNDFLMQLRPVGRRIVTDASGHWKRASDGVFIDPQTLSGDDVTEWEREDVARGVAAEIRANIEAYWQRAVSRGDATGTDASNQRMQRDNTDPHGILALPDVRALRGAEVEP